MSHKITGMNTGQGLHALLKVFIKVREAGSFVTFLSGVDSHQKYILKIEPNVRTEEISQTTHEQARADYQNQRQSNLRDQ